MNKRKNVLLLLLIMVLALSMTLLPACKDKSQSGGSSEEQTQEEQQEEEQGEEPGEEPGEVAAEDIEKTISEIDTEDMMDIPLQIESITLLKDGSVRIVPTDDLLKIAETNNEVVDGAVYPFEDSGKVKDIYLVRFGNGGYRTLICLMEDGSLSALSAEELITDHIFIVMDNLTGRDTYVSVKETTDTDSFLVYGITEEGEEVDLDFSLDF